MPTIREIEKREYYATLEQKAEIQKVFSKSNELHFQMLDSAITFLICAGISGLTAFVSSTYMADNSYISLSIKEEQLKALMPWLETLHETFPMVFGSVESALQMYYEFGKLIDDYNTKFKDNIIMRDLVVKDNLFRDIGKIIGNEHPKLIEKFFKICFYAKRQGISNHDMKVLKTLAVATPILRYFAIDPILKLGLHRLYGLQLLGEADFNSLSDVAANKLIQRMNIQNQRNEKWAYRGVMFNRAATLLVFLISLNEYLDSGYYPAPEYILFVFVNVVKMLSSFTYDLYQHQVERALSFKLSVFKSNFDNMLSCQLGACILHRGKSFDDSYILFRACDYKSLASKDVNHAVKEVLLNNKIEVLDYNNYQQTIKLHQLTDDEITTVKSQIETYLVRLINIKILEAQLKWLFVEAFIIKNIYVENGLPTASFTFQDRFTYFNKLLALGYFKHCKTTIENKTITIVGHEPSKNRALYGNTKAAFVIPQGDKFSRLKHIRNASDPLLLPPSSPKASIVEAKPERKISCKWNSGAYDSTQANNQIRPLNSTLLGRNHFILFAIPREYFPSQQSFEKIQDKIAEGRFAANAKGCQGLQFREELSRDLTKPNKPWVKSHLRAKFLGELGDIRCSSRKEVDPNGNILHVFCGIRLSHA